MKKRALSLILALSLMLAAAPSVLAADAGSTFTDVRESDWFYSYVMELSGRGMVNGVGDGSFAPNNTVTAADFFTLAARLVMPERIDLSSASEYWAYPYYDALLNAGIIESSLWGRSPELWTPSDSHWNPYGLKKEVTRRRMAEVLYELAGYMGESRTVLTGIENNIPDSAKCSKEALWAYSAGVITGKSNGTFDPDGYMTRAEMCTVFCRLMGYTPRAEVTVQSAPESDYYITSGIYKGMLKEEVAREYGRQALAGVVIGEDENGVYLEATAPVLPEEMQQCTIRYQPIIERPNGDFFVENMDTDLQSGQSVKKYFTSFSWTPVRASEIGAMRMYVSVEVPGYEATIRYLTDTSTNQQVMEILTRDDGDVWTKVDLDVSHIFRGIGK